MTRIKLCGLSRPQDIAAANTLQPEYVGFVFAPSSRRFVSPAGAKSLRARLAPGITAVGVFVDEDPESICRIVDAGTIDWVQLHGKDSARQARALRTMTDAAIVEAFKVRSAEDVRAAEESAADYILLDAGAGDGTTFDWMLAAGLTRPFFLAGGLHADNVGDALAAVHPFAVDVSSGIETNGHKDPVKMAAFVSAARKESNHA